MGTKIGYCEICNKQFVKYRPYQKYCSNKCRLIASEKYYKYNKKDTVKKKCLHCGKEFKTNLDNKKYCSKKCYNEHQITYHKHKETETRTCKNCGAEFETTHHAKVYCSKECYIEAKHKREKQ